MCHISNLQSAFLDYCNLTFQSIRSIFLYYWSYALLIIIKACYTDYSVMCNRQHLCYLSIFFTHSEFAWWLLLIYSRHMVLTVRQAHNKSTHIYTCNCSHLWNLHEILWKSNDYFTVLLCGSVELLFLYRIVTLNDTITHTYILQLTNQFVWWTNYVMETLFLNYLKPSFPFLYCKFL